jgi:hypothetical protein
MAGIISADYDIVFIADISKKSGHFITAVNN